MHGIHGTIPPSATLRRAVPNINAALLAAVMATGSLGDTKSEMGGLADRKTRTH